MTRFRMSRIVIDQFALMIDTMPENMGLELGIGFLIDKENRVVAVRLSENFKNNSETVIKLEITCSYSIHPDDWEELKKDGEIELPCDFMEILASQAVGASRGILFCKTEGTGLNGICLPPINVHEILSED